MSSTRPSTRNLFGFPKSNTFCCDVARSRCLVFVTGKEGKEMEDDYEYIYVAYITTRSGRRIYACQYGLKCFRIRVKRKQADIA